MTISIEANVDKLVNRLNRTGRLSPSTTLYTEGIKGKFCLARYCVEALTNIEHLDESVIQIKGSTGVVECVIGIDDQVLFYCDSFWNILRSSIDILGQLINELKAIGIPERQVYFTNVNTVIQSQYRNTPLQKAMRSLTRSQAFKDLNEYRRCVTHRRQVYVQKDEQNITYSSSGTPGYIYADFSTTEKVTNRYLCKNPWDIIPIVDRNRPVSSFNKQLLEKIEKRLSTIISRLP